MADITSLRLDLGMRRRALDRGRIFFHDARARLAQLRREADEVGVNPDELARAEDDVEAAAAQLNAAEGALRAAREAYDAAAAAEPEPWPGGGDVPLLLLPVRLEAVHARVAGATQLLIRVYPDEVHVDAHEEGLTAAEREAGERYWEAVRVPGGDEAARSAWTALLARLGPARAAWALEALRPGMPEPESRAESWTRAARTMLLPDRFAFSAYTIIDADGTLELAWREEGADIPDELKLGFAPPEEEGVERPDRLPWDEESRWLVDFQSAVDNGMGLERPLPDPDVNYDLLTVVGVGTGLDAEASAARWQAALLAHQHGNGLAFLPTRTPTNNTPSTRSGWRSRPEARPPEEVDGQRARYEGSSAQAAARAARAFGVDGKPILSAAPDALDDDAGADLEQVHRALGLLFNQSMLLRPYPPVTEDDPPDPPPPDIPQLLEHFTAHVRSRGTLPTLRIGRQPYGVLPVSSLDLWKGEEPDPRLIEHLSSISSTMDGALANAPRVGVGEDQDSVILDLLSRVPASERVTPTQTRRVGLEGPAAHEPPFALVGSVPAGSRAEHFRTPEDPTNGSAPTPVAPRPVADAPSEEIKRLLASRPLAALLDIADRRALRDAETEAEFQALEDERSAVEEPLAPYLESLTAASFYRLASVALTDFYFEIGFDLRQRTDPETSPEQRASTVDALRRARDLAAAFVELEPRAMADPPGLDRLLLEVLDTLAHRIDAWITSLPAARLQQLRESRPTGLRTGAYGWLTDVHDPGPLPPSDGYVMTPSLQHAATAAVLRSGWQAHSNKESLAVDLQSWRVRAALEVVDGVRTGQPLGALLGYRFERGLHEAQLDAFIDDFRRAYPLPLTVQPDPDPDAPAPPASATSIGARNVVDGQRLRQRDILAGADDPLATDDPNVQPVFERLLADLDETVDAVGDLLLAESVHHLVGGNPLRAGLSADAIGRGEGLPQEFEVVRTPRSATAVVHHIGILGPPGGGGGPGGWSDDRPLAQLEPAIEGWCRARLGAASDWRFGQTGGDAMGLDALGWCALDVVSAARSTAGGSPLESALRQAAGGAALDEAGEERSRELGLLCEQLRAVLAAGTALLANHLDPGETDPWKLANLQELGSRVGPWLDGVLERQASLTQGLAATPPDVAVVQTALQGLADRGLVAALPVEGADLAGQGAQVLAVLEAARLEPLPAPPSNSSGAEAWARTAMTAVSAVLGDHVKVVPILRLDLPGPDRAPSEAGPDAVADWVRGVAPVRPGTAALDQALAASATIAGSDEGVLAVTQMPVLPDARWVATAAPVQGNGPPVRSTAVLHHDSLAANGTLAGLVVDSWSEAVPRPPGKHGPEEIAGLAFHHDRPDARAPQAVLLAVPPDVDRGWRLEDVHGVVEDTERLARMRTLDLRDFPELRRLLPVPTRHMERYETIPRATGIEEGLAARVHDPLWFLARQWQFGEFRSENAASIAQVDIKSEVHLLDRWRAANENLDRPYDRVAEPLERLVEQEALTDPEPRLRLAGGLRLRRALQAAGHGQLVTTFARGCPFPNASDPRVPGAPPAPAAGGLTESIRSRLPDGRELVGRLERLADPATRPAEAQALGLPAAALDDIAAVATDWLAWWTKRAPAPSAAPVAPHPPAWDPHRLEYAFELGATTLPDVRLGGEGYTGGRLDWWALDAAGATSPSPASTPIRFPDIRAVPSPARFGGMPAPRFWEMEDARFDPGAVDAAPNDLGRLLLTSFATVYGNDWFTLPVRLPVGSLTRVKRFMVTDVFGGQRLLEAAGAASDGWSLFALTDTDAPRETGQERPTSPWFYLAAAMPDGLEGEPAESVLLLRDEMANLAWAVEARLADDAGDVIDRFGDRPEPPEHVPPAAGAAPRYRIETEVPHNWYPLAPEKLPDRESILLRLVPLARSADEGQPLELPLGRLLRDDTGEPGAVTLHEEEVPRTGVEVTRSHQHARWHDGSVHAWTGRTKRTGGGEGSSGLHFDFLESPPETTI